MRQRQQERRVRVELGWRVRAVQGEASGAGRASGLGRVRRVCTGRPVRAGKLGRARVLAGRGAGRPTRPWAGCAAGLVWWIGLLGRLVSGLIQVRG